MQPPISPQPYRGRGAASNPASRFIRLYHEREWSDPDDPAPTTHFYRDAARTILAENDSSDIPFRYSLNPYRGCEHGCIYCYARPTHEYLGFSAGLDFETRVMVKEDAPQLLRAALADPAWQPQTISLSGVTDPYQPVERRLCLTRRCLEVLAEFRNPVGLVTKNALVGRDRDLLAKLAESKAVLVLVSVTSLDDARARVLEPRASTPSGRLRAIEELTAAGIPTGVLVAPVIPGLTDHEMPAILQSAASAGARCAAYSVVRLPGVVGPLFEDWLEQHFPAAKSKVLSRIRELHGGTLEDSRFGTRMRGQGIWAQLFGDLFRVHRGRVGIPEQFPSLSTAHFRRARLIQRSLFDDLPEPGDGSPPQHRQPEHHRDADQGQAEEHSP